MLLRSVENASFDDLITKCDILSFHCKATSDGKPMLTKDHMKQMKPTSYVINAARGNIVDENDLNEALNEGLIAGAAVDVFSKEPAKENVLFNNSKGFNFFINLFLPIIIGKRSIFTNR